MNRIDLARKRLLAAIAVAVAILVLGALLFSLGAPGRAGAVGRLMPAHAFTALDEPAVVRNMRQISWWPYGPAYDVAYEPASGLLLAGSGGIIMLLDVSDPARPIQVSSLQLQGQHQHMEISDRVAYITTYRRNGVQIVDLSNPTRLQTLAFFPTRGVPQGIEIAGDVAYVGANVDLEIIDISNPRSPRLMASFPVDWRAAHTWIVGSRLYLTVWGEGVYVLDISEPAAPVQLGFFDAPKVALFAVRGDIGMLAEWYETDVRILDVSNPASFKLLSTFYLLDETQFLYGTTVDIELDGSLAYFSGEYWDHLQAVDLADPLHPTIVGSINAEDSMFNRGMHYVGGGPIDLVGDTLYQAAWTCGVGIFDVSTPAAIRVVGNLDTPDPYLDVAISGHIACIANQTDGLRLIDVSDPSHPSEIGAAQAAGWLMGQYLRVASTDGHYAYVAAEGWGLQILDIARPESPLVAMFDTEGIVRDVALAGGYAYLADGAGGLRIVDVGDPSAPNEAGFCLLPATALRIAVAGSYAYVGTDDGRMFVVDVSRPAGAHVVGTFQAPASSVVACLAAAGNEVYLGTNQGELYRLDITHAALPQLKSVTRVADGTGLGDILIAQGRAYVADEAFGLRVFDITDSPALKEIAFYQAPGTSSGVDIQGDMIYFTCDDGGLLILALTSAVTIDHARGAPGSYFNVAGDGFPASQSVPVSINGTPVGSVTATAAGTFTFTLTTTHADEGSYRVAVGAPAGAVAKFSLDNDAALWPQEGDHPALDVPGGIAHAGALYMPALLK